MLNLIEPTKFVDACGSDPVCAMEELENADLEAAKTTSEWSWPIDSVTKAQTYNCNVADDQKCLIVGLRGDMGSADYVEAVAAVDAVMDGDTEVTPAVEEVVGVSGDGLIQYLTASIGVGTTLENAETEELEAVTATGLTKMNEDNDYSYSVTANNNSDPGTKLNEALTAFKSW